jgi:hypothetical protein
MTDRWRASGLTLLMAFGLALAGCSQSPLAPGQGGGPQATGTAPPMLTVAPDGQGEYVPCDEDGDGEGMPPTDSTGTKSAHATMKIDGADGGTLTVGRFTLKLPPGAFTGTGMVTMTMRDTTVLVCELDVTPSTANAFRNPAELTADLSGLNVPGDEVAIYWYDPTRERWDSCPAQTKDAGTTRVTAYLQHFSTYGAGKAGW